MVMDRSPLWLWLGLVGVRAPGAVGPAFPHGRRAQHRHARRQALVDGGWIVVFNTVRMRWQ